MKLPFAPVGYDYAETVRQLNKTLTYEQIAEFCGYESRNAIYKILKGGLPAHPQGEALWVLYRKVYGRKPPQTQDQVVGQFSPVTKSATTPTSVGP